MNWEKFFRISRALTPMVLLAIATSALFLGVAGMPEWSAACASLLGVWAASKGYKAVVTRKSSAE